MTTDDMALVREYASRNSQDAFATLVSRHVDLVYSVALQQVRNPHLAEEVTQVVFIILARKSGSLNSRTILSGWLCRTARFVSANALKIQQRRQRREQEAFMQSALNEPESDDAWTQIAPLLSAALAQLGEIDHDAVILRFFQGKNMREIGAALGVSENAAKTRISRAVEKLRAFFVRRGAILSTAAIAGSLSAHSVQAAPVGLAKSVVMAATKGTVLTAATSNLITTTLKIMAWTKAKTAIVSAVILGLAAASLIQHQTEIKLRHENDSLQEQMAQLRTESERLPAKIARTPRLPAPPMHTTTPPSPAEPAADLPSTLFERLKDKQPKLTREQTEAYLNATRRNAVNLLAAFRTSGDAALLHEAMQKFPNDPQVAFEAAFAKDLSPEEQRRWLDAFEQHAPENALANYLSALNYFNSGQIDRGVEELAAASGKSFNDYTASRFQDDAEAFLAAGYSTADAKASASMQLLLPQLAQMKQLSLNMIDLANAYREAGDTASAQTTLQMAANMGQNYVNLSVGEPLISQLVGIAIETSALKAMEPGSPYGDRGQTVQDRLNQLAQQKATIHRVDQQFTPLQQAMSDQDWITYTDRRMLFGEADAEQWVVNKYGQK